MRNLILGISLPVVFVMAGCVSTSLPAQQIASSEGAIRAAREMGAPAVPNAALHLKLAEDNYTQAKKLIEEGDNERAAYLLLKAEADADVAAAEARTVRAGQEAQQVTERLRVLRERQAKIGGS